MTLTHIFYTGATGYIGGAVLDRLLQHQERQSFDIHALVRSAEKAKRFESDFGIHAIVASLDDHQVVEDAVAKADIFIHTADADNYGAALAILRGLKRRYKENGKAPILIHTSGTGVLTDKADGMHTTDVIYFDSNAEQIESLPDSQAHRNVDLEIVAADKEGYARTYIILPSTIYGLAKGPLFSAGLANPHSVQIPQLIKAGIQRGQAGVVGKGINLWPNVWIDDVADLFIVVFDKARKSPESLGHGREGFYFGENGEHQLLHISEAIGRALVKTGKASDPSVTPFTDEECKKFFGGKYLGSNSRARAERSRSIGWNPTRTTEDLLASIEPETEAIVASGKYSFAPRD